jgi:3-methyladenine DNA glycosylase AlkD
MLNKIRHDLSKVGSAEKAGILARFFKTGKGEYGEGDIFLGVTVPEQRKIAKKYYDATLSDLHRLLASRTHEHRLVSLLVLIEKYKKADDTGRKEYADFYLAHLSQVNNWDLVDLSAGHILGEHLLDKDRTVLFKLAESRNLWERRIAIISTFAFIKKNEFEDTLKIAQLLLRDSHDLIHKAVGWMLREVGKRNPAVEESFLKRYHKEMPRTMLRYAIERFDHKKRMFYMQK